MTTENIALQAWRKDISYILHAVQGGIRQPDI